MKTRKREHSRRVCFVSLFIGKVLFFSEAVARQDSPEDGEIDADDDLEMRRRFIEQPQQREGSQQKNLEIPLPKDLKSGKHVVVPEILNITEVQIRRAMRRFEDESVEMMIEKMENTLKQGFIS